MKTIEKLMWATMVVAIGSFPGVLRAGGSAPALSAPSDPAQALTWVDVAREEALNPERVNKATERGAALLGHARWAIAFPFPIPNGNWIFYDAGDFVIGSRGTNSFAVNKATGKLEWQMTVGNVRAAAAGAKGAEMAVTQPNPGYGMAGSGAHIEMMGVGDRVTKWQAPLDPFASMFLMASKQVFAGTVSPPIFVDGPRGSMVLPAARSGTVVAYDRQTGARQWSYTLPGRTLSTRSLLLVNDVLYVEATPLRVDNSPPCTLIALHGADGKPVFVSPPREILSPLAVKDDVIVASSQTGVVGFDAKTGEEKWQQGISLTNEPGKARLTMQEDLESAPVVLADTFVVPTRGMSSDAPPQPRQLNGNPFNVNFGLAALDLNTHQQAWFFRPPTDISSFICGVQFEKGKLVAATTGIRRSYMGVDPKTGKLDWLMPLDTQADRNHVVMSPLLCDGVLYMIKADKLMAVPLEGD